MRHFIREKVGTKFVSRSSTVFSTQKLTRRERLKSALYLRLKMRKRLFLKKHENFDFFSFRKCRIVPKNVKRGTLWALLTYILLQNIKKFERGTPLRQ